jgi:riboflavin kinase/FMN adenylyltransferase
MAETTAEDFAQMLKEKYRAAVVVCGTNYRFGRNAAGKPEHFEAFGLETHVVPPVVFSGRVVSSTYIRESVRDGRVGRARQLLGRPFFLEGPIVGGFQVGRTIGYPTINIRVENGILMPHRGVYVSRVTVDGQSFKAVTNVGTRPTFTDADIVSVESHLLDFSGDIYGHEAQVEFLKFLRPERSFKDGDALRMQIAKDIRQALEYRG